MLRKHPFIKWSLVFLMSLIFVVIIFGLWFMSLIPEKKEISQTRPEDLSYLSQDISTTRGKILIVVTSTETMGSTQKKTGYELTELARSYYVFKANRYQVDIASPKGGKPPVIIDWDDMGLFDYAFLNDSVAQNLIHQTIPVQEIRSIDYDAIVFMGGKGAMFDFPDNARLQSIIKEFHESGKVIGAICHGPAALVNVMLENGRPLLESKSVCSFTNSEELFLLPDATDIFPFLLESELRKKGAQFISGSLYLENVVKDGNLITGQNPWSTWAFAEAIIRQLGHKPKVRKKTAEENTVRIISTYERKGYADAKRMINRMIKTTMPINRKLIAIHVIIAAMQMELQKSWNFTRLLNYIDNTSDKS